MKNLDLEKEIELINSIVEEAIDYGGDRGGAYFTNKYTLKLDLEEWIAADDLQNQCIIEGKDWIHIVKKWYYCMG